MKDIKCPNCGTVFQVDESHYAEIVAQVRSKEFESELQRRLNEIEKQFESRELAVRLQIEKEFDKQIAEKSEQIAKLKGDVSTLTSEISNSADKRKTELAQLNAQMSKELYEALERKDKEIYETLQKKEKEISATLEKKEKEIFELKTTLGSKEKEHEVEMLRERELHKTQLADKQSEIERLKDFKMRLSTKMVGETLEQHCANQFASAQSLGLYPEAVFMKDNTVLEHSKGDFIFRDFIKGQEYVSVMFEMKNEMDTTATKHRNDDFLDKLDKDRTRKGCEYAVLVSMLEQGNELYDSGIVDKSYRYPKMIVIRPQFFLPVLRLITEGSRKGYEERAQLKLDLEEARSHSLDFARFEEKINKFRTSFNNNVTAAHKKFMAATEGIDKTIDALEKQIKALRDIKANFEASEQKLLKANEYADENLTVKKLTHGNPNIRRLIDEAGKDK